MNGPNDPSNLVELTIEEHAEAHKQLWMMYRNWQDEIAYLTLSGQIGKEEAITKILHRPRSEESKRKNALSHTGMKRSEETRRKMSNRRHSAETKLKMSLTRMGKKRGKLKPYKPRIAKALTS